MTEQQIQSKIKKYAESKGWIVIKTIKLSEAGYPDLFMFKDGKTIFIEVKKQGGIISPLQELRQRQLREQGFTCEVIDNLEQFKNEISR
jgi:Holliday junction resolvase-like predicted endonuclease